MTGIMVTVPLVRRVHKSTSVLGTACGAIPGAMAWDNARGVLVAHTAHLSLPDIVPAGLEVCSDCKSAELV